MKFKSFVLGLRKFSKLSVLHKGLLIQDCSVPTDLVNWGPSGPDRTTKIFRTGPNGPGPDLPEKECDKMVQKTVNQKNMPEFDYTQCSCLFLSLC